ncbi:hypothetical protein CAPTEDRAFT_49880, partial [Capitella teleta]
CEDTIGSFVCTCAEGYQLSEDQVHCEDIHECEVFNGGCSHICVEEEGGYYCSCP